jgi:acetate kinase
VVHGGSAHTAPARIGSALIASLKGLVPLAPLHMPAAISGIEAALAHDPSIPQVACFDTAFHARMPERAARFPLPERFYSEGIRRYGFHGLSYEYALSMLGDPPPARVIVAHLGNGASVCAIENGCSIDTTMGLTPSGGIMMGTRAGDLDPGLLLYLQRAKGYDIAQLEALLNHEAGLAGVGGSSDLRLLETRKSDDAHAGLALEMFGYQVRKTIGAYVAALGGVDCLVFTGGIGEHSAEIRSRACRGLDVMGIELDEELNESGEAAIHSKRSACRIFVLESDEDRVIARHAARIARTDCAGLTLAAV